MNQLTDLHPGFPETLAYLCHWHVDNEGDGKLGDPAWAEWFLELAVIEGDVSREEADAIRAACGWAVQMSFEGFG